METVAPPSKDALWQVLARVDDSPEAAALARALPAREFDPVDLVRALHLRLIREASPEEWVSSQLPSAPEWDAAVEWAALRGRQAHVLAGWLDQHAAQTSLHVEEQSSGR